jgi:two-component system, chemotaxis family, sensor kinase CheA
VNEFLQQFLIESRELADAASSGLLALEQSPHDAERLDEVLRALHTLKGGAGIVDFAAMERAVHTAEEVLTAARAGRHPLTAARVGQCLTCLDQVMAWLDTIERSGALPESAASQAEQIIRRFEVETVHSVADSSSSTERAPAAWLTELLKRHPGVAGRALTAVRLVPATDCLHRGADPLARMMSLPHLVALDFAPHLPWGPLDTLDPFSCNLVLTALSAAPVAHLQEHLRGQSGDCEVLATTAAISGFEPSLPPQVTAIIKAQQALIGEESSQGFVGRVASAGLVAANALRSCGRVGLSQRVSRATEQSLLAFSAQPLERALRQLFAEEPTSVVAIPEELVPSSEVAARTFRIDAEQVDALVRLAGELTVVNNAFGHVVKLAQAGDPSLLAVLKDRQDTLQRLVDQLQRSVLRMRVRPLAAVLQRFPRVVREMSAALGKSVKLIIEGDETEADKAIVEMLFEPLLHIVRNAIDHGVESEKVRAAAGKAAIGTLRIKAQRRADQVLIEVSDDGAGIDVLRVREVALARSVITEEQLLAMTETAILDLIFAPGFSTATAVTQMSGRGVGMDAVRRAVERLGGQVSIASTAGQGTDVKLSLPFSVMMTHLMTVEAGGQMFGLPLEAIIETARVPQAAISKVGGASVVVLRNRTLPLIDLASVLGAVTLRQEDDGAALVVAAANGEWAAFRVDRIVERLDLMVKPLDGLLTGTPGIMGTTLLGDGRVLLVLDIAEMLQ